MENIVEDVKEDRETEGCPANSQGDQDIVGCDLKGSSRCVNHYDDIFASHQSHHCQAGLNYH